MLRRGFYVQEHFRVRDFSRHLENCKSIGADYMSEQLWSCRSIQNQQLNLAAKLLFESLDFGHLIWSQGRESFNRSIYRYCGGRVVADTIHIPIHISHEICFPDDVNSWSDHHHELVRIWILVALFFQPLSEQLGFLSQNIIVVNIYLLFICGLIDNFWNPFCLYLPSRDKELIVIAFPFQKIWFNKLTNFFLILINAGLIIAVLQDWSFLKRMERFS